MKNYFWQNKNKKGSITDAITFTFRVLVWGSAVNIPCFGLVVTANFSGFNNLVDLIFEKIYMGCHFQYIADREFNMVIMEEP